MCERQKGWSPAKTTLRTIEEELLKVGKVEGYGRHSPRVKPSKGAVRERQKGWSPAKTALCTNEEELLESGIEEGDLDERWSISCKGVLIPGWIG